MEGTRDNASRFGLLFRDRGGHEGAASLFTARRERHFKRGLLSEEGYDTNYALFRPSRFFARMLGDGVLRLNEALYTFREQAADHILFLEGDELDTYYGELDQRAEKVRDQLVDLTAYCGKGFDGEFGAALESVKASASEVSQDLTPAEHESAPPGGAPEVSNAVSAGKPDKQDVFEAVRQASAEAGILTDLGREAGWVAFRPCPFYGRLLGELVYTFNDALLRVEGRTSHFIARGNGDVLRQYYGELRNGMTALQEDLEGMIACCKRKVV